MLAADLVQLRQYLRRRQFPAVDCDDVAMAICYLASDEARFITAQALAVDGGVTFTNL